MTPTPRDYLNQFLFASNCQSPSYSVITLFDDSLPVYVLIDVFSRSFICSFDHVFIHLSIHPSIHPSMYPCIPRFIHTFIHCRHLPMRAWTESILRALLPNFRQLMLMFDPSGLTMPKKIMFMTSTQMRKIPVHLSFFLCTEPRTSNRMPEFAFLV